MRTQMPTNPSRAPSGSPGVRGNSCNWRLCQLYRTYNHGSGRLHMQCAAAQECITWQKCDPQAFPPAGNLHPGDACSFYKNITQGSCSTVGQLLSDSSCGAAEASTSQSTAPHQSSTSPCPPLVAGHQSAQGQPNKRPTFHPHPHEPCPSTTQPPCITTPSRSHPQPKPHPACSAHLLVAQFA